jgi:hypothetical protein
VPRLIAEQPFPKHLVSTKSNENSAFLPKNISHSLIKNKTNLSNQSKLHAAVHFNSLSANGIKIIQWSPNGVKCASELTAEGLNDCIYHGA